MRCSSPPTGDGLVLFSFRTEEIISLLAETQLDPLAVEYWALQLPELQRRLDSTTDGLSSREAERRLLEHGPNTDVT